jgi:hypothetical protein
VLDVRERGLAQLADHVRRHLVDARDIEGRQLEDRDQPASTLVIDRGLTVIPSCSIATRLALVPPPYICCHPSVIRSMTLRSLIGDDSRGRSITPDSAVLFRNDLPAYCWIAWNDRQIGLYPIFPIRTGGRPFQIVVLTSLP